jgi:hypothetical protein
MDAVDLIIKISDEFSIPLNHAILIVLYLIVDEKIKKEKHAG